MFMLLVNSILVAFGTVVLALLSGLGVALAVATAGPKLRTLLLGLAAACLALPPFLVTNTWLDVTADWRGLMPPEVVGRGSLVLTALTLASLLWPLTTFLTLGAWSKLQPEHLEADPQLRGGRLLRGLLLPAARHELGIAGGITVVLALANFTVPTLFQVRVFTEEFWIRFNTQLDTAGALRASWPLTVIPLGLLLFLRNREVSWPRWQAAAPASLVRGRLGGWAAAAMAFTAAWLAVSLLLPLAQLGLTGRTWTELPGALAAGRAALWNSLVTAAFTATLTVGLGLLAATTGSRPRGPRWTWLMFLIPGVFLGVVLINIFNRPGLAFIYQSLGIVLLGLTVRYVAPGWAIAAHAVRSADSSLVEAARSLGASRGRVLRDVLWPQAAPGLAAAWYAVYLLCLWDVETVVLIQPPGGETLALRIFNLLHYGHGTQVNALCVLMVGMAVAPLAFWSMWRAFQVQGSRFKVQGSAVIGLCLALCLLAGCSPASDTMPTPLDSRLFASVQVIGSRGVAPGQFNKPRSLACDRDGNLYVADITGRVQKFSPEGKWLLQWQMPQTDLGKPKGMGCDHDGNILVIEPHYQRVNHFSPGGELVAQWGVKGTNAGEFILPRSVAQNSRGEFYLSEYTLVDRVQRFVVGPAASLVAGSVSVRVLSTNDPGRLAACPTLAWGTPGTEPGQFNRAEGLGLGLNDEVLVADSCNHRIQVFDRDGKFLRTYGQAGSNPGEFSYPYDVRVDASGNQFICEFGNSRITVLDPQDHVVEVIGGAGAQPGRFANPWAIALDSQGNLYVADSQNHRVQKLVRKVPSR